MYTICRTLQILQNILLYTATWLYICEIYKYYDSIKIKMLSTL